MLVSSDPAEVLSAYAYVPGFSWMDAIQDNDVQMRFNPDANVTH